MSQTYDETGTAFTFLYRGQNCYLHGILQGFLSPCHSTTQNAHDGGPPCFIPEEMESGSEIPWGSKELNQSMHSSNH